AHIAPSTPACADARATRARSTRRRARRVAGAECHDMPQNAPQGRREGAVRDATLAAATCPFGSSSHGVCAKLCLCRDDVRAFLRSRGAAMQIARSAVLFGALTGCYAPAAREGAPCESSLQCPAPQHCVLGACLLHDRPQIDAAVESP